MVPTKTDEQTADILTKSLNKVKFKKILRSNRHGLQDYFGLKFALRGSVEGSKSNFYTLLHNSRIRYFSWSSLEYLNKINQRYFHGRV